MSRVFPNEGPGHPALLQRGAAGKDTGSHRCDACKQALHIPVLELSACSRRQSLDYFNNTTMVRAVNVLVSPSNLPSALKLSVAVMPLRRCASSAVKSVKLSNTAL